MKIWFILVYDAPVLVYDAPTPTPTPSELGVNMTDC